MIYYMRKHLITFLFTLFSLGSLTMPTLALSDDSSTLPEPTTQPDEEPECELIQLQSSRFFTHITIRTQKNDSLLS